MGSIEWDGYVLGDLADGHDFTIGGKVGVKGLGTSPRDTVLTPNRNGGDTRGESTARSRLIEVDDLRAKDRATALAFLGTMGAIAPDGERPLILRGLIWGDPEDEDGGAVQAWVGPERADPTIDVQAVGLDDWRITAATWIASDPTFYSVDATVIAGSTPHTDQALPFTNTGNGATLNGRAWTCAITAAGASVYSPYVDLGDQRVTWAGLRLHPGQTLRIDRHRHSWVGSLGVDAYRHSHGTPNPDWPVFEPGLNEFAVGANAGPLTAALTARSTWVM